MTKQKKRNLGVCKVNGCETPAKTMDMCGTHYAQYRRGRIDLEGVSLRPSLRSSREVPCRVSGCLSKVIAHGWCSKHYQQVEAGLRLENGEVVSGFIERNSGPRSLSSEERAAHNLRSGTCRLCSSPMFHGSTGFCSMHYARYRRGQIDGEGKEIAPLKRVHSYNGVTCKVEGCSRRPKAYGLCDMHRQQELSGIINSEGQVLREKKHGGRFAAKDRWTSTGGYIRVRAPDHPRADKYGFVLEHRLVAEQNLGRFLEPYELVHHRNGNRTDNRWENLQVLDGRAGMGEGHPPGHEYGLEASIQRVLQESLPGMVKSALEKLLH